MNELPYSTRMSVDGAMLGRALTIAEAIIFGSDVKGRASSIKAGLPEDLRGRGEELVGEIVVAVDDLERQLQHEQTPVAPPKAEDIPEALRPFGTPTQLLTLAFVNNVEDREVNAAEAFLAFKARGQGEGAVAAGRLHEAWFADGKVFLGWASREQWVAVRVRFRNPTEAQLKDIQTLNIQDDIQRIQAINAWHGELLGIPAEDQDAAVPAAAPVAPSVPVTHPLARLRELSARAVALANVAFPGSTPDASAGRALLLSGLLGVLAARRRA